MTNELQAPMFSISLQRNTIDIGGEGMLTVGKLPDGIDNSSLTWVPVRLYSEAEGGMTPPTFARDEVYPYRWEVELDGVFLDGAKVPDSALPVGAGATAGKISALIDTGNSLLRGPSDVVTNILKAVSPAVAAAGINAKATLPCDVPHTMAFSIGGKMFPVDPRDFIGPVKDGDTTTCVADNLVATDRPSRGALFSWSLGDPFLKSNLVAFHYGNLSHPSVDPPRMGFMSLVPNNADALLNQAVDDAEANSGRFDSTYEAAPTASANAAPDITLQPTAGAPKSDAPAPTSIPTSASKTPSANRSDTSQSATVQGAIPDSSQAAAQGNSALSSLNHAGLSVVLSITFISSWYLM